MNFGGYSPTPVRVRPDGLWPDEHEQVYGGVCAGLPCPSGHGSKAGQELSTPGTFTESFFIHSFTQDENCDNGDLGR